MKLFLYGMLAIVSEALVMLGIYLFPSKAVVIMIAGVLLALWLGGRLATLTQEMWAQRKHKR